MHRNRPNREIWTQALLNASKNSKAVSLRSYSPASERVDGGEHEVNCASPARNIVKQVRTTANSAESFTKPTLSIHGSSKQRKKVGSMLYGVDTTNAPGVFNFYSKNGDRSTKRTFGLNSLELQEKSPKKQADMLAHFKSTVLEKLN